MSRELYARLALAQIPRLLSLQDRNPFSPTYGCCNREYWLCRTTDFPSAIAQFGIHALALAWRHPMPDNLYHQQDKVRDWVVAGIEYWMRIQHRDGSFDEFYPNERGWAGPTGFLLYAMIDSYRLLGDAFPDRLRDRFFDACHRAAAFLASRDEPGVLANHHAMAALPVFEAARLLESRELWAGYTRRLEAFYRYCDPEGWCLEYDGADPGYLSATVSFLGKIYKHRHTEPRADPDGRMGDVLRRAVEFCAYFVYPDGHYGGTIGSRQTLHFYPHGFELLASENPLAAAVADRMLEGLAAGALVPPHIQEDRYCPYRVPEFLLAYVDYGERPAERPPLPCEGPPSERYFPRGGIFVRRSARSYLVVNLAKGGVIKFFDAAMRRLAFNDCGILAELDDGRLVTSQWIDPSHPRSVAGDRLQTEGCLHRVPTRVFRPLTFIAFRLVMLALGWHAGLAERLKGWIRSLLMTRARGAPVHFRRTVRCSGDALDVEDVIELRGRARVRRLLVGDEVPVRYVPQSRYFQPNELLARGWTAPPEALARLNSARRLTIRRRATVEGDAGDAAWE